MLLLCLSSLCCLLHCVPCSDILSISFSSKYKYVSKSKDSAGSYEREYKFLRKKPRGSWDWRSKFDKDTSCCFGLPETIAGEKLHRNGAIKEVKSYRKKPSAIVIFLHGSGGTGVEMRDHLMMFKKNLDIIDGARHIRFMFPSAPVQPYTALFGQKSRVWHDRQGISDQLPEMKKSVEEQAQILKIFIDNLVKAGTPINRIAIGGFSMGGGMALHMAYRYYPQMAGCFTLSSFLHNDSMVYEALSKTPNKTNLPPLIAFHGDWDNLVPYEWGQGMFSRLKQLGVQGEFHLIKNTSHEIRHVEVDLLYDWYNKFLPKLPSESTTAADSIATEAT